jgi:tagatose-1,6-bisphosphate aldolase non-catalytic subunit AgaZ/GatZ
MSDAETRYLRAAELLAEADWVFDAFVNAEMRKVLVSAPEDAAGREAAYTRARVATEMKANLARIVEEAKADAALAEKRDRLKEGQNGRS